MYNDYDDDYIEPEKNAEFREAIDSLIDGELKSRDEETHAQLADAKARAEKYSKLYYSLENEKRQSENKHKGELEAAIKESKKLTLRELTQGFTAGDVVYIRIEDKNRANCETCKGKSEILVPYKDTTVKAKCPDCNYGWVYGESTFTAKKTVITHAILKSYYDVRERKFSVVSPKFYLDDRDSERSAVDLYLTEGEAIRGEHANPQI